MLSLLARLRVVADLVVLEPERRELFFDARERLGDEGLVEQRQAPAPRQLAEARALLDRQRVGAQVRHAELCDGPHLRPRLERRLPGDAEDQIRRNARHARSPRL